MAYVAIKGQGGGEPIYATVTVTCMAEGDSVELRKGQTSLTGTAGSDAQCAINIDQSDSALGEYTCYVNTFYWGTVDVADYVTYTRPAPRFGYRKTKADSNPATRIAYLFDAEGLTPAAMNFTTGVFDYGDWTDFMAVKGNYPVMLKYDGTEDYKLDPDDYTKKEDGVTASDVSNTSYGGNAMSAFPRMWVYRYEDTTYEYCIFCPVQYDANYLADAFINHAGDCKEKFYLPCFKGATVSGKLRSLKGKTPDSETIADAELTAAEANNPAGEALWTTIPWSRRAYLNDLLVLIGKSTNTQAVFGHGSVDHGSTAADFCTTGSLSDKGQFWGSSTAGQKLQHKVFHCEGVWGDRWDRMVGLVNDNGAVKVKMRPPYSLSDFTTFTAAGIAPGGASGGYISATKMSALGCIPTTASGTATTYEADAMWFINTTVAVGLAGCNCSDGNGTDKPGGFALMLSRPASYTHWTFGASPSCDMPS